MGIQVAAVKGFLADESAAGLFEYAILLLLIALACVVTLVPVGNEIKDMYEAFVASFGAP